jgi:hypothetical protein
MNLLQTTHFVREFLRGIFHYCLSITAGFFRTVVKKHTYGVEGETKPENVLVSFLFLSVPTTIYVLKNEPSQEG